MEHGVRERTINLDAESILAEAREKTGLDDFGDDSFREPMVRLLRSMEEEAELSAAYETVREHGGTLEAGGEPGTLFVMRLPSPA